jgi:hypothetical protein
VPGNQSSRKQKTEKLTMKPLLLLALLCLSALVSGRNKSDAMSYRIVIQFNPESNFLNAKAEILNPTDSIFYLAKGLKIISAKADGKPTSIFEDDSVVTSSARCFCFPVISQKMEIEYSGKINPEDYSNNISSMNGINQEWIELSNHIDWYPRLEKSGPFGYEVEVNVPKQFTTVLGGQRLKTKETGTRSISQWKSVDPAYGITLVSVPGLKNTTVNQNGIQLEIYYSQLTPSYIDSMKNDIMKSIGLLNDLFGSQGSESIVKMVYSPRVAGGYARRPMLLVSEKFTLEQVPLKFGYARDFRLNTHEIAHYWSFANTGSSEDWMNEGLAEFSAFLISEKIIGKEFSYLLLSEYEGMVKLTRTHTAIAETPDDSWEREINRYYKPTLLFNDLRNKYGEEKVKLFLNELYFQMVKAPEATTGLFLDILGQTIGKEARDFFSEAVYRKGWDVEEDSNEKQLQESDKVFEGTWSGILTQFGTANKFVLNLILKNGQFVPTLGSPDQNVSDIPVTELLIDGDQISYRVAIASATYKGKLDRASRVINGVWTQRGVDYPLNISQEN